jgi:hypothetical protein
MFPMRHYDYPKYFELGRQSIPIGPKGWVKIYFFDLNPQSVLHWSKHKT